MAVRAEAGRGARADVRLVEARSSVAELAAGRSSLSRSCRIDPMQSCEEGAEDEHDHDDRSPCVDGGVGRPRRGARGGARAVRQGWWRSGHTRQSRPRKAWRWPHLFAQAGVGGILFANILEEGAEAASRAKSSEACAAGGAYRQASRSRVFSWLAFCPTALSR